MHDDPDCFEAALAQPQYCNVPAMQRGLFLFRSVNEALWELSRTCRRTPRVRTLAEKALAPQQLWPDLGLS